MGNDKFIKKASAAEIVNHWILALSFFILVLTGFGILYKIKGITSLFKDYLIMRSVHEFSGIAFTISLVFTTLSYLEESLHFDKDDMQWLKRFGCYLSKCTDAPPQGRLTAAQKIFYLFILITGIIMAVTGVLIWLDNETLQNWMERLYLIHKIVFFAMIIVVPMHMLVVTLLIPKTLRVIIFGNMSLEWAKSHHAKWLTRRKSDRMQ